eukprot:GCRY01005887.1.p1 GENE.GCRY01005887.1~~GCRY01005887.1.p1  ORF type:complete len:152 (-),score=2.23 GCRY01005887.1:575-1030(-)
MKRKTFLKMQRKTFIQFLHQFQIQHFRKPSALKMFRFFFLLTMLSKSTFQLFGVTVENLPSFLLYLIDEAEPCGKGADAVISLIHDVLTNKLSFITAHKLYLQADNCPGQNKNNAFVHFILYLVQAGIFDNVQLPFMIAGHTKVCRWLKQK